MKPITIKIPGVPIAWARMRRSGGTGAPFEPPKQKEWKKVIKLYARKAMGRQKPFEGPIFLNCCFSFIPPKSWYQWKREAALGGKIYHTSKPDTDNLTKLIKDALTGIVWVDDAQVYTERPLKIWAITDETEVDICPKSGVAPSSVASRLELAEWLKGKAPTSPVNYARGDVVFNRKKDLSRASDFALGFNTTLEPKQKD